MGQRQGFYAPACLTLKIPSMNVTEDVHALNRAPIVLWSADGQFRYRYSEPKTVAGVSKYPGLLYRGMTHFHAYTKTQAYVHQRPSRRGNLSTTTSERSSLRRKLIGGVPNLPYRSAKTSTCLLWTNLLTQNRWILDLPGRPWKSMVNSCLAQHAS